VYPPAVRLVAGIAVPNFSVTDLEGEPVTAQTYAGRRLWLILARFAACPFCSLLLRDVVERHEAVAAAGVEVLVIFPSSEKRVSQFAKKYQPGFRVAADPEQVAFEQFGSETSWEGEMRSAVNIPKVLKALLTTKMNPLAIDDAPHRMPSGYLIEANGMIGRVHYGSQLDDGIAVDEVLKWAQTDPAARPS